MPNFKNVGSSLSKELKQNENTHGYGPAGYSDNYNYNGNDDEDEDEVEKSKYQFRQIDLPQYGHREYTGTSPSSKTPELAATGGLESDTEEEVMEFKAEQTHQKPEKVDWEAPENIKKLKSCQAAVRNWLDKKALEHVQEVHQSTFFQSRLQNIQAQARGVVFHRDFEDKRVTFETSEEHVIKLQAASRGFLARRKHQAILQAARDERHKLIQTQHGYAKNQWSEAELGQLSTDKNPSVETVKNFIHLLDDSNLDFDFELALEDLRQRVIQHIRENKSLELHVTKLDIQISLLVRNAITIDEVIKTTGAFKKQQQQQRRYAQLTAASNNPSPYTLKGVDKESRQRLELYQQLVYLLQTEPKYLARLMSITSGQDLGDHTNGHKRIESTVLALFGYATNIREEYLLIKLCKYCIAEEMRFVKDTQEFMRGNYTFMKLVVQTNRGAKEREFFRKLLTPLITLVVGNDTLDLETDPVSIYNKAINEEESRTGMLSQRKPSATSREVLAYPDIRETFILHLRNLREITENFLTAITSVIDDVPYGIRVVARELRLVLEENFPDEGQERIVKILGNFIYYRYLNPAVVAPEQYDVIDDNISPVQRKNLAEISKMLQQISSGKVFDADDMFLAPLNDYVFDAGKRFANWFMKLTDVEDPETFFGMDPLADIARTNKPMIYISPYELYYLHYMIETNLDSLETDQGNGNGTLADIIKQIGQSPYSPGDDQQHLPETPICLSLSNRAEDIPQDPASRLKQLLVDTKRLVVYVIKSQSGPNLRAIFEEPVRDEHEENWKEVKEHEFGTQSQEPTKDHLIRTKRRYLCLNQKDAPVDLGNITFFQLKTIAHRLVMHLERCRVISDTNDFQDMINMIAQAITGKNSQRKQRGREINKLTNSLEHLQIKRQYIADQRKQYDDYLQVCMNSMASKRGKRHKFMLPFTRQYFHIKRLEKQGLVPRYGSYKYTARQLHDRGIIVELSGIDKKHYDRIPIILSMDQAGIITIGGSYSGWGISSVQVDMRYESLLQTQFEGVQTMKVLDGFAKVNVNLLIYLINKK
ncbi:Rho GTPase activation protein [Phycomyces nitens]|nr:Rho GTPase activation protein [Phycomyces nitens]